MHDLMLTIQDWLIKYLGYHKRRGSGRGIYKSVITQFKGGRLIVKLQNPTIPLECRSGSPDCSLHGLHGTPCKLQSGPPDQHPRGRRGSGRGEFAKVLPNSMEGG